MEATIRRLTKGTEEKGIEIIVHFSPAEQAVIKYTPTSTFAAEVTQLIQSHGYWATAEACGFLFPNNKQAELQLNTPEEVKEWVLAGTQTVYARYT